MQSSIRTLTGYAQNAHKAGNMGLRRTRLARSGLNVEDRVTHCSALLRMFGPSWSATLVKHRTTTMASADFCGLTRCIPARRAVWPDGSLPLRSLGIGQHDLSARSFRVRHDQEAVVHHHQPHRHGAQISPGKDANSPCTNAPFTLSAEPMGFAVLCQLASTLQAFYVVSVRRLARLHSGFLQTIPHGSALAVG